MERRAVSVRGIGPGRSVVVTKVIDGDEGNSIDARNTGLLQFEKLTAVLQGTAERAEDRDAGGHFIDRAKRGGVGGGDNCQFTRSEGEVRRETKSDAVDPPGVGRARWIEKRPGAGADILHLDKFRAAALRMVMHFVEDDRADARTGIGLARGAGRLGREMFLTRADDVASKRFAIGGGAEAEAVAVAGQVAGFAGTEQVDFIPA